MDQPIILIQARSTSTRLPGKVLKEFEPGWTLLDQVVAQCRTTGLLCVVVCPTNDVAINDFCRNRRIPYYEGSEQDVLSRYYDAATAYKAKWIMRITSDCPFVPVAQMHYLAHLAVKDQLDWATNLPTIDGWDIDLVSYKLLTYLHGSVTDYSQREHVTSFLHANRSTIHTLGYRCSFYQEALPLSKMPKLSVDTLEEWTALKKAWDAIS